MKAAKNFSFGDGKDNLVFKTGDPVPDKIADQLADEFILEKVAEQDPSQLSREQLIMLAGLGEGEATEMAPIEYDEDELREALATMRSKGDIKEWFDTIRPNNDLDTEQTRAEMVDAIVLELTGDEE